MIVSRHDEACPPSLRCSSPSSSPPVATPRRHRLRAAGGAVGIPDLPVVRRVRDSIDASAVDVTIGTTAIAVAGQPGVTLTNGALPPNVTPERIAESLVSALAAQPNKSRVRLRVHSVVPYGTLLAVLRGLKSAGVEKVGFVVRKPMSTETGVLVPAGFDVRDPSPGAGAFRSSVPARLGRLRADLGRVVHALRRGDGLSVHRGARGSRDGRPRRDRALHAPRGVRDRRASVSAPAIRRSRSSRSFPRRTTVARRSSRHAPSGSRPHPALRSTSGAPPRTFSPTLRSRSRSVRSAPGSRAAFASRRTSSRRPHRSSSSSPPRSPTALPRRA